MAAAEAGDLAVNLLVPENGGFSQRESGAYTRLTVDAWTAGPGPAKAGHDKLPHIPLAPVSRRVE